MTLPKGVEWMAGMLAIDPDDPHREDDIRVVGISARGCLIGSGGCSGSHGLIGTPPGLRVPDFDDPATIGCLEAQAMKKWSLPYLHIQPCLPMNMNLGVKEFTCDIGLKHIFGKTKAELLLAILAED